MRILVIGSRRWRDWHTIEVALREYALKDVGTGEKTVVVHGACPTGADMIADVLAPRMGLEVERYPADWERLRKAAGPIRNEQMVQTKPDIVLAFLTPDSRGTRDCVKRAERDGIPVRQFHSSPIDSSEGDGSV